MFLRTHLKNGALSGTFLWMLVSLTEAKRNSFRKSFTPYENRDPVRAERSFHNVFFAEDDCCETTVCLLAKKEGELTPT